MDPATPAAVALLVAGVPVAAAGDLAAALDHSIDRRRRLLSYVRDDSWGREEVVGGR